MAVTAISLSELRMRAGLAVSICVGCRTADDRNGTWEAVFADKRTTAGYENRGGQSQIRTDRPN